MRHGDQLSLLDPLHKKGCTGTEYSVCRPVATSEAPNGFEVVYLTWCGTCGAADWEAV